MAINFPNSPTTGDPHTENGVSWVFNGKAWIADGSDGTGTGPVGPTGPEGPEGPQGPAGVDGVDGSSGGWNNKPSEMNRVLASDGSGDLVADLMTLMGTGSSSTNNESNNFTATLTQDIFSIKIIGISSGINGEDYIGSSGLIEVTQDATGGHVISPQHPLNIVMSGDPADISRITPETGVGTIGWYKYGADAAAIYLYISDVT